MAINFTYETYEDLLKVKTNGYDESYEQALEYGQNVVNIAYQNNCSHILCDETELQYRLTIPETYNLVHELSYLASAKFRIAIVSTIVNKYAGKFFILTAGNRGATIDFFTDMRKAEKWLDKK
ncbi:MAG: hypothetical protein SCALA702_04010 [Melioribacteraceae bacterium]|nr:MAG: hypothetical protein SCALA702_04010 [Melioribacteraceae bacterium]